MNNIDILTSVLGAAAALFAAAMREDLRDMNRRFKATMDRHDRDWAELQRRRAEARGHLR